MAKLNIDDFRKAVECGIINEAYVRECIENMKRTEILKNHSYKITQGKDGKWRTYVKDSTKPNGCRLIKKSTEKKLQDELVKYYSEQENKALTFKDVYFKWREVQDELVTDNSVYKYNTDYKRFFKDSAFEQLPIAGITEDMLKLFFHDSIKRNNLTKGAFKKLYGYVNNTFAKAYREKIIVDNPMIYFTCKQFYSYCEEKEKPLDKQIFSKEEEQLILEKLHSEYVSKPNYIPNYAVEFSSLTGMRVGEIVALRWEDVHMNEKYPYFTIDKSEKYNRVKKEFFIDKTKNKKIRKFTIDDKIKHLLLELKKVQFKYGFYGEWVFANEEGRLHAPVVSSCIKNKCRQLNITERGIHAFRKTLNSDMRCSGVSDVVTSALLGHSPQVNREYYTFDTSSLEDKANIVAKIHACG